MKLESGQARGRNMSGNFKRDSPHRRPGRGVPHNMEKKNEPQRLRGGKGLGKGMNRGHT